MEYVQLEEGGVRAADLMTFSFPLKCSHQTIIIEKNSKNVFTESTKCNHIVQCTCIADLMLLID